MDHPNARRIEVSSKIHDMRAEVRKNKLRSEGFDVKQVDIVDVYTVDKELSDEQRIQIGEMLANPITEKYIVYGVHDPADHNWIIEVGFLPGVTDNVATTAREGVEDMLQKKFEEGEGIYTSQLTFLRGDLSENDVQNIATSLANPAIQHVKVKSSTDFFFDMGMGVSVPRVVLDSQPKADIVNILDADDEELTKIGKEGVANADDTRRGPLALDLQSMKAIQSYFRTEGRNPTDVEVESLGQTWSEHCKHTIFADPIDEIVDGLYETYIKSATTQIRKAKGKDDFCISVFTDNSGAIVFDEEFAITDKAETHNSPSALDPFGGAITGIVGVDRDAMGFGKGAKPIAHRFGFCFADPEDNDSLYKVKGKTKMLPPRTIMDGVIEGVNVGGNCSGIPTPQGFLFFDKRYKGKPLVFVGTIGLIPREINGKPSHEKKAEPGDYIVMVGGRVGKDGVHGATFSSEGLNEKSPAGAVQIGDPITQKKMSDALIKEARDLELYNSITDNGAGGISCSIGEMAKECGGCVVELEKVPLKYHNLPHWETWVSESQERMTVSVPKEKWNEFSGLMNRRGVEATVIGEFTDSKRCIVNYNGENIMDVDMEFLHDGVPQRPMKTTYTKPVHEEPSIPQLEDLTESLHSMLGRLNIASFEFISQQYDHEVQGGSVLKPLQGRGRVNGNATALKPVLGSEKGIVISHGINPSYSDIDTYHMAACAIDTAVRNAVAAGANLDHLGLMDNFCWCSSNEPERLGQLKEAARACHDYSIAFGTPFISGKDSMFNDFKGFDKDGEAVKISVPPTLLVSSISVVQDASKTVSLDAKISGDLVYVLGITDEELGGSEYFAMVGEQQRGEGFIGNRVPKVDADKNNKIYRSLSDAIGEELVASAQSVTAGGLGVALAKTAMGGRLGMDIDLSAAPRTTERDDFTLYSQSSGRIVVTVAPEDKKRFEEIMQGTEFSQVGVVREDSLFRIKNSDGKEIINTTVDDLLGSYKARFEGF